MSRVPGDSGALWYDDDAGPMVRAYTVTRGRTCSRIGVARMDMIAIVTLVSAGRGGPGPRGGAVDRGGSGGSGGSGERGGSGGPRDGGRVGDGGRAGESGRAGDGGRGEGSAAGGAGAVASCGSSAASRSPRPGSSAPPTLSEEHLTLLERCRAGRLSVAELAAQAALPLGVVRVLLGDLLDLGRIRITAPVPPAELPAAGVLQQVINGLRSI